MTQGADILGALAAFLVLSSIPLVRDLAGTTLAKFPAAAALIITGAYIYQTNQRVDLFVVAIAGGLAVIAVALPGTLPGSGPPVGDAAPTAVFESARLKHGVTVGAVILYIGVLAYPQIWNKVQDWHGDVPAARDWPVLTLPAYYFGDNQSTEGVEFQKKLFFTMQSHFQSMFLPLEERFKFEPQLNDDDQFLKFSERFSVRVGNLILLSRALKNYRSADCKNNRLLLHAEFRGSTEGGQAESGVGDLTHRLLRCKPPERSGDQPRLSLLLDEPIQSLVREEQFDLVALTVSVPITRHLMDAAELSKLETNAMWQRLTEAFRQRYEDFEYKSLSHEVDWLGHRLAESDGCADRSVSECAEAWKRAYEDIHRYKENDLNDRAIPMLLVAYLLDKAHEFGEL